MPLAFNIFGDRMDSPMSPPITPAAIGPQPSVKDVPVQPANPFGSSFLDLMRAYLWSKLMFDPRPLQSNDFFSADTNPGPADLNPTPMTPPGGAPILPPGFR